jgi:hypothetical protein
VSEWVPSREGWHRPSRTADSLDMESAVEQTRADSRTRERDLHLLRDCLALGVPDSRRRPAKVRLEEAVGPELAQKLLRSLSAPERR